MMIVWPITTIAREYVLNIVFRMWFSEFVGIFYLDNGHFESLPTRLLLKDTTRREKIAKLKIDGKANFIVTQGIDGKKRRVNRCLGSFNATTSGS